MIDVGRPSLLWVVPPLSRWGPGIYKNKAEQANVSKPVSGIPPWHLLPLPHSTFLSFQVSALAALDDGLSPWIDQMNPSLPTLLSLMAFTTATGKDMAARKDTSVTQEILTESFF